MTHPSYVPATLLVYLIVVWLLRNAAISKAKREGAALVFDGTAIVKGLLSLCIVGFTVGSVYASITPPQSTLVPAIFAAIALMGAIIFPATIVLTETGIRQTRWWGSSLFIPWQKIARIEYHKGPSTTVLIDEMRHKIVHSGFHRGRQEFLTICQQRSHLRAETTEF